MFIVLASVFVTLSFGSTASYEPWEAIRIIELSPTDLRLCSVAFRAVPKLVDITRSHLKLHYFDYFQEMFAATESPSSITHADCKAVQQLFIEVYYQLDSVQDRGQASRLVELVQSALRTMIGKFDHTLVSRTMHVSTGLLQSVSNRLSNLSHQIQSLNRPSTYGLSIELLNLARSQLRDLSMSFRVKDLSADLLQYGSSCVPTELFFNAIDFTALHLTSLFGDAYSTWRFTKEYLLGVLTLSKLAISGCSPGSEESFHDLALSIPISERQHLLSKISGCIKSLELIAGLLNASIAMFRTHLIYTTAQRVLQAGSGASDAVPASTSTYHTTSHNPEQGTEPQVYASRPRHRTGLAFEQPYYTYSEGYENFANAEEQSAQREEREVTRGGDERTRGVEQTDEMLSGDILERKGLQISMFMDGFRSQLLKVEKCKLKLQSGFLTLISRTTGPPSGPSSSPAASPAASTPTTSSSSYSSVLAVPTLVTPLLTPQVTPTAPTHSEPSYHMLSDEDLQYIEDALRMFEQKEEERLHGAVGTDALTDLELQTINSQSAGQATDRKKVRRAKVRRTGFSREPPLLTDRLEAIMASGEMSSVSNSGGKRSRKRQARAVSEPTVTESGSQMKVFVFSEEVDGFVDEVKTLDSVDESDFDFFNHIQGIQDALQHEPLMSHPL